VGTGWATVLLSLGLVGLLFHASFDRDYNYRRLYLFFGCGAFVLGAFLCILPYPLHMGDLFGTGYLFMCGALLFVLAPLRNEDEAPVRGRIQFGLAIVGGLLALVGLYGSLLFRDFLLPTGLLLAVLGLVYLASGVGSRGTSDDLGYRLGLAIGLNGALVFLLALFRSLVPLFSRGDDFLFPWGIVLMALGVLYGLVSLMLCSESRLVVLTRRELEAFFYSPMAYIVLIGFTIANWYSYFQALAGLILDGGGEEPIIAAFVIQWWPIICMIFIVPALTMRLVSEERRTGTLEVLLTTPTDEVIVVLSKFLAALVMYLVMWLPLFLFLLAVRLGGGKEFDYRPLLGFSLTLLVTGSAFISMGVFFSTLTRNQIVSAVLTFAGMLGLTMIYFFKGLAMGGRGRGGLPTEASTFWNVVLQHMSYLDLWINSVLGRVQPKLFLFPISLAVLFLFLSVKVLEGRKWS
jgi:ABC-2 type transport system permease protein